MRDPSLEYISGQHNHQQCVREALHQAELLCQKSGQRLTAIRRRVLELVWRQHKPIGAYEVLALLQEDGRAAPPTVYRALDFLQELGLVHRIASLNAYVGCTQPQRPHQGQFLICTSCQLCAELNAAGIVAAIDASAALSGFQVHQQRVEIMGLCPACQSEEKRHDD